MEEFGKKFSPKANKSLISKWESGKSLPNNERIKRISELGNVPVKYLLNGEQNSSTLLESEITQLEQSLYEENDTIQKIQSTLDNLKEDVNDNKIEDIRKQLTIAIATRDFTKNTIDGKKELLSKLYNDEIFNIHDRENIEFQKNGISQHQLSKNFSTIPYLLNYESTMKVVSLVDKLMADTDNLFKP